MAGGWVDTTDVAILVVFAAAVFYYFSRGKKTTTPPPQGKKLDTKAPSTSNLKVNSNAGGLNGKMNNLGKDVVIFYGSQTGTAEDYANRLAREGKQYGFQAMVADLEDYELSELADLEPNKLVIFAVATYGEGEPTDNAQEAFKFLNEEHEADMFKNLHYTVFGLGNKTYEHYNEVGKHFDAKLETFGAKRVFELGLGDDDGSLEEDYVTWRDRMWPTVGSFFGKEADQNAKASRQYNFQELDASAVDLDRVFKGQIGKLPKPGAIQTSPPYDLKNPYMAEIVVNRELMKGGDRNCMHLEVKIKDTPLTYQTGDHLGIFPQNDPEYVERLGKRLGLTNLDQLITLTAADSSAPKKHPFPCPTTYRTALSHYLDIHSVCRTHILKALLEYDSDEAEKAQIQRLISVEGKEEVIKFLQLDGRGILEVLEFFPSAHPPADLLFELLPRLQCRYYSISSSPEVHPETISISATVSNYVTASGRFGKGVCTNFLFNKKNPELQTYRIPVFVRRSNFKLPKVLSKPIIMVGPGTGLAPFRGFIEERAKKRADGKPVGPNVLFFGCRRRDEDFLYQEELEQYKASGDLELFTAFSRETEKKVYVQHLIAEQKKLIWGYLEQGAIFYICGDAKNMARDVNKALQEIVKELGGKTDDEALQFVKNLRTSGRYLEDVWS